MVDTGKFTGRSPKDKYIVKEDATRETVWWGNVNREMSPEVFSELHRKVTDYYNEMDEFYVFDGYCGANRGSRRKIRFLGFDVSQHHFVRNMFIRPDDAELTPQGIEGWGEADFTVINACGIVNDDWERHGLNSEVFVAMSVEKKVQIIGGTSYCGEMKKGIFTMMNYWLPQEGILPMHCSANKCPKTGTTALFFGLSGTGKTTLSADPNRLLIGDDEHGWDDEGVFNFEGGCYAKTIDLDQAKEPEIWDAIRTDALLENVVIKDGTNVHGVDFADTSKTPNGRVAYPLHHIANHEPSGSGSHPEACIFLTCDAFGVLPPVARLSAGQAMYHFISGFTAKVAGTERGIIEPVPTFSACFGGAFLPLHPSVYANLLQQKLQEHGTTAYLVNTGWSGGAALNSDGTARPRMDIPITRAVITAILDGSINDAEWCTDEYFGFEIPSAVRGVAPAVLNPSVAWKDKVSFDETSRKLCKMFVENFKQYEDGTSEDLTQYGPLVRGTKNRSLVEELVLSPRDPDEHIGWGMPILN